MTAIEIDNVVPLRPKKMEAALALAREGYLVFPIVPNGKLPLLPGKGENSWKHYATRDEDVVRKWWTETPDANIARLAGEEIIVDVDINKGGFNTLSALELEGWDFPPTRTVETWSGGRLYATRCLTA